MDRATTPGTTPPSSPPAPDSSTSPTQDADSPPVQPPTKKQRRMSDPSTTSLTGAALGKQTLTALLADNVRHLAGDALPAAALSSPALRLELAKRGQKPVAAVLACADSRVAPEIVFGAGLGRVFVVRNAGNVAWGDSVLGSLEYAVDQLAVPLVLVLGHTCCGAVGAAVAAAGKPAGHGPLAKHVSCIADVVKDDAEKEDAVAAAVVTNVRDGVSRLCAGDTILADKFKAGEIAVLGAVYDIETGEVTPV